MNKYVKTYATLNESVQHNGIILIKGKPKGKSKDQMLYAAHVISSAEVRPGAVMLFLSDQFYRIVQEGERLKGVKINWRSEESLKDSLNLKSPGKISLVKNNNKTPYHWKTLKETSISQALDKVKSDLLGSDYLFESIEVTDSTLYVDLINSAIDSIYNKGKSAFVLGWKAQGLYDLIEGEEDDDGQGSVERDHTVAISLVYTDPELVESLINLGASPRQTINFEITSEIQFTSWYHPGDYMNPPEGDSEVTGVTNEITSIYFNDLEEPTGFRDSEVISRLSSLIVSEDPTDILEDQHVVFDRTV
jgi:hypothetical protein